MVRRALSLRRGSTLSLEIETNPSDTTQASSARALSQSLPGSDTVISRSQPRRDSNSNGDDIPTGTSTSTDPTQNPPQRPRTGSNGGRLPLSKHHQIRKKSMSSMTGTTPRPNTGNKTTSTVTPPPPTMRSSNNPNSARTRTNSSCTSVSLTSTNSSNGYSAASQLDDELGCVSPVEMNRAASGLSSMLRLEDELAVIIDE